MVKNNFSSLFAEPKKLRIFATIMKINLTEKQKELIEKFGVAQEKSGLAPASARVNALLIVSDDIELTFDDIKDSLHLSKSAVSNAINNLLTTKRIGYKTKPGDRKRYFYSTLDHWNSSFRDTISSIDEYINSLKEIMENRTPETKDFNHKITDFTEFLENFRKKSLAAIDDWETK